MLGYLEYNMGHLDKNVEYLDINKFSKKVN